MLSVVMQMMIMTIMILIMNRWQMQSDLQGKLSIGQGSGAGLGRE
jgi:hypothetical protein